MQRLPQKPNNYINKNIKHLLSDLKAGQEMFYVFVFLKFYTSKSKAIRFL